MYVICWCAVMMSQIIDDYFVLWCWWGSWSIAANLVCQGGGMHYIQLLCAFPADVSSL